MSVDVGNVVFLCARSGAGGIARLQHVVDAMGLAAGLALERGSQQASYQAPE